MQTRIPSPTGLFWDIIISWYGVKINSFANFKIFVFYIPWDIFCHLHVISDWFSNIFPPKPSAFSAACHIQSYRSRKLKRLISQNPTSSKTAYSLIHKTQVVISQKSRKSMNLIRGGSRYGPNLHRPPFWQLNHANLANFGAILATRPLFTGTRPPLFTNPGSSLVDVSIKLKPKVCSLQWLQKPIWPKMSLVLCFFFWGGGVECSHMYKQARFWSSSSWDKAPPKK